LVEYLVDGWLEFGRDGNTIFEELLAASSRDEHLRKRMLASYESLEASIADEIKNSYPGVPADICRVVAHAVMSVAYGSSTMFWLGFDRARYCDLRQIIWGLFKTLEKTDSAHETWAEHNTPPSLPRKLEMGASNC
jgi:hypothetical protein